MKRKKRNVKPTKQVQIKPAKTENETPATPTTGRSDKRWLLYPIITFSAIVVLAVTLILILSRDLPSLMELERASDPLLVTRIYSADGQVMKRLFRQRRVKVSLDQMPSHLLDACISTEDRKFYRHWGIDLPRFTRAIMVNLMAMSFEQGASTITQQLARKVYLHPQKTIIRKLQEQLTALQIERTYSKSEILEMYLNQMPLGRGAHGVQAASMAYFGKKVQDLDIQESAMIVGMLQLPYGYYNPDRDTTATIVRRNVVLFSMMDCGHLTRAEYDSLKQLPLAIIDRNQDTDAIAPYFCEYVRREMERKYGMGIYTDGLSIYTSLDTRVQAAADSAINAHLPELEASIHKNIIEKRRFVRWVDPPLETEEEIQAFLADTVRVDSLMEAKFTLQTALTAINPKNGRILAMVGGRDFKKWKFNRAVQMKKQPGSVFKPFVYTTAIDNGYPPCFELMNQPVVIMQVDGSRWQPPNYDHSTGGLTTLREGLKRSLNLIAVRLVQEVVSPQNVVDYAKHFGITTKINPYDAIALGTDVVIPLEIAAAYSVFANRGVRVEPVAILRVEDKDGNVLEENIPEQREVISEQTAYIMYDMMKGTLESGGTGHRARWGYQFYRPAGGKTGTTNDYRNAWFSGYTPQIVSTVWVGFDDERITLGEGQTGAAAALPIWAPFMKMAHDTLNLPLEDFPQPEGVTRLKICSKTKKIATSSCPEVWDELFLSELAPTDTCEIHQAPGRRKRSNDVIF